MKNKPISPETLQPQADYNPYDRGVAKAIEMTRRNSRMNHEQELEAFRNSINAFSKALAGQGRVGPQRGLLDNLAALNVGTVPAMEAYGASEKNAEAENQAINQQLMLQEEKRQKRADKQAYQDWQKTHAENQLAETTRGHNLLDRLRRDKLGSDKQDNKPIIIGGKVVPQMSPEYRKKAEIAFQDNTKLLKLTQDAKSEQIQLNKELRKNGIDPNDTLQRSKFMASLRNKTTNLTNNESIKKIQVLENSLNSKTKQINFILERTETGKGVTDSLLKFGEEKDIYLDVNNRSDIFNKKIKNISEVLNDNLKSAAYGMFSGAHISPFNLGDYESENPDITQGIKSYYDPSLFGDEENEPKTPMDTVPTQTNTQINTQNPSMDNQSIQTQSQTPKVYHPDELPEIE